MSGQARIQDARDFGRVAVLMGGSSLRARGVARLRRATCSTALQRAASMRSAVDGIPALVRAAAPGRPKFDRVFNILHGNRGGGEDGMLQGLLEALGVPYTGSGVLGSALSMDKIRTKQVWLSLGLPTPALRARSSAATMCVAAAHKIGLPVIVKPACEGSSVGVSRCFKDADLPAAVALAARYDRRDAGRAADRGRRIHRRRPRRPRRCRRSASCRPASTTTTTPSTSPTDTQYICPGSRRRRPSRRSAASRSPRSAPSDCSGWGRVDFMRDRAGRPWLLEVNTAPGMTSHSLVPKAARAARHRLRRTGLARARDELCRAGDP